MADQIEWTEQMVADSIRNISGREPLPGEVARILKQKRQGQASEAIRLAARDRLQQKLSRWFKGMKENSSGG
jgi:hypothetical protein